MTELMPVPRDLVDPLLRELGGWLGAPDPARREAFVRGWDDRTVAAAQRLLAAHGVASHLARTVAAGPIVEVLPGAIRTWIEGQDRANRERIDRLHGELAAALRAFAAAGLPVLPLKGSILSTRAGADPYRRPMADLDLLVRPADLEASRSVLAGLGYRRRPEGGRLPTHDTFERPGNDRVVSADGEHPDNPRPIELHVEVKRHLWGWVDDDDLTPFLWLEAHPGSVLGEPAMLPSDQALLAHLAIHATSDLLVGRGRLVQWLDLAEVAGSGVVEVAGSGRAALPADELGSLPHPRLVLPSLRLAARRLPDRFHGLDLTPLEARVPGLLARWSATVPLDSRAGLQAARLGPNEMATSAGRWSRWAPSRWRLAVAHGDQPLPIALLRHGSRLIRVARRRAADRS
ncbi:MAG TPA: nucleotidyltransferase family protein [Candidatus Limnocylindrales bacterium]|nr:nucleotidyltransferase family protein [Candidatus Limnocylindrales bacterium]